MAKPADIRYRNWSRLPSHTWTDTAFRAPVLVWLDRLITDHNWIDKWAVVESFHDNKVNVRVPMDKPYHPAGQPTTLRQGFLQRDGIPLLTIAVLNDGFECALAFPKGVLTEPAEVERLLEQARLTFRTMKTATLA